jgi:hypothetical protein
MASIYISNGPSGHIIVSFPYDPLLVARVKTIDGRRWHLAEKYWSLPNAVGTLEKILKGNIRSPLDNLNLERGEIEKI